MTANKKYLKQPSNATYLVSLEKRSIEAVNCINNGPSARYMHSAVVIPYQGAAKMLVLGGRGQQFCQMSTFYFRPRLGIGEMSNRQDTKREGANRLNEELADNFVFEKTKRVGQIKDLIIDERKKKAEVAAIKRVHSAQLAHQMEEFETLRNEWTEKASKVTKSKNTIEFTKQTLTEIGKLEEQKAEIRKAKIKAIEDAIPSLFSYPKQLLMTIETRLNVKGSESRRAKDFALLFKEHSSQIKAAREKLAMYSSSYAKFQLDYQETNLRLSTDVNRERTENMVESPVNRLSSMIDRNEDISAYVSERSK